MMNETSRGWLVSQLYNDSLALSSTKVGARGATSIGSGLAAAINVSSFTLLHFTFLNQLLIACDALRR